MEPRVYTLTELGVFIGVVCTGIASLSAGVVAIITAWRTGAKVDKATEKIDKVHELTNSNYTEQKNIIATMGAEIKALTAQLAIQEKSRAVLAAEGRKESEREAASVAPPGTGDVTGIIIKP